MSKLYTINLTNVKSALVFAVITAIVTILIYIIGVGDIFALDYKVLINLGVLSLFNGILSLLKSLLTTSSGEVAGIQVK